MPRITTWTWKAKNWHTPSNENQVILALTAEIRSLKEQFATTEGVIPEMVKEMKWMSGTQKSDEAQSKRVGGKTFNWCAHNKAWRVHTPSECHLAMLFINAVTNGEAQRNLVTAIAVVRMDESWLLEGTINYLCITMFCITCFFVPTSFVCSISCWIICLSMFYSNKQPLYKNASPAVWIYIVFSITYTESQRSCRGLPGPNLCCYSA